MVSPVYVKTYAPPQINEKEILRYSGVKGEVPEINSLVNDCLDEMEGKLTFKVCYTELPVNVVDGKLDLTFTTVKSEDLAVNLKNCSRFVLFAATVGVGLDRLIAKYNALSPAKALVFQAIGAERIESLCNLFNKEITEKYKTTKPRFSPGYGDLPLDIQRDIFNALECSKKIGLTLNESLLMSPSKSVTAIIGVVDGSGCASEKGHSTCKKTDCEFRSERCL